MRITSIVGARPQFIKLAAIVREIQGLESQGQGAPQHQIIHTGQHYDYELSQAFFDHLDLPAPDFHLGIGSRSHGVQTGLMLQAIEQTLTDNPADMVLVYGDTNSTLAGAIAASKMHIPVAHIEAGLRSYNRAMPEELNRVLTDHASDLLFCPTQNAIQNLRKEGFTNIVNCGGLIERRALPFDMEHPLAINVGDVMHDLILGYLEKLEGLPDILDKLKVQAKKYYLATVHRAENTDNPERLNGIFSALNQLSNDNPVIFPAHPRTQNALKKFGIEASSNMHLVKPQSYLEMLRLQKHARVVLTDSGGVQKEACWLGTPCVTLRDETEWGETLDCGANVLAGTEPDRIVSAVARQESRSTIQKTSAFGDGHAAERIIQVLMNGQQH